MVSGVRQYLRRNVLSVIAIFIALNAGAYAASNAGDGLPTGSSKLIGPNQLDLKAAKRVLQSRVDGACTDGASIRRLLWNGDVNCTQQKGSGFVTSLGASGRLASTGDRDVTPGVD